MDIQLATRVEPSKISNNLLCLKKLELTTDGNEKLVAISLKSYPR